MDVGILFVKVFVEGVNSVFVYCCDQSGSVCLYVAKACSSMFCITISATTPETGLGGH